MRYRLWLSILSVIFTVSLTANVSAEKWELPDVGKMEVPPHVHFEEGEQSALPFLQDKGIKLYFTRKVDGTGLQGLLIPIIIGRSTLLLFREIIGWNASGSCI